MSSLIMLASSELFPGLNASFISIRDTGTERSSCLSTDGKSTGRPAS